MIRTFNPSKSISFEFTMDEEAYAAFNKFVDEHPEYFSFEDKEEQIIDALNQAGLTNAYLPEEIRRGIKRYKEGQP